MKHGRNTDILKEEHARQVSRNRIMGDRLVEKWSKTDVGVRLDELYLKDPQKARNTAIAIHNQEQYLKRLSETVISTAFAVKPENILKIVRIGTANRCRGDIFTEQPLQTTDDALFYIDMTYDKSVRGATAGQKMYEQANPYYASEQVRTTIDGSGASTSYSVTLSTSVPIIPGSVHILVGGAIIGTDNGSNGLVSFTSGYLTGTNTIDYTTGAIVITFAAAPLAAIELLYNWNSEESSLYAQYGTVGISVNKKRFNARPMPLGYNFSEMTKIMMSTTGLGDSEALLVGAVGDEHAKATDYRSIAIARAIALGNNREYFDTDFAKVGEVSDYSHAQTLLSKIGSIGGVVYDEIKRGVINKAIAGSQALVYMKKHALWKDDNTMPRIGVYKAGTLSDIDVYACPAESNLVNNNDILLTFKNPEEGLDISVAFGTLTEITAQLSYPTFYTEGNFAAIEDHQIINRKFTRILTLQNL